MMIIMIMVIIMILLYNINGYRISSLQKYNKKLILSSTFESSISPETILIDNNVSSSTIPLPNLAERRPLKTALLALAARTKRGEIASEKDQELAFELITRLEGFNPVENPCDDALSLGKWELIYSSTNLFRSSPFFMAARAVCKDGAESDRFNLFCDLHRDALAFTNMGKISQIITKTTMCSEFETFVPIVPGLPITITGTIVSNADIVSSTGNSWTLFMDKVRIKENTSNIPGLNNLLNQFTGLPIRSLGSILENTNNVTGYTNPKPIFYTYYVDTHMRISRDQDDNVFVYNRVET